MRHELVDLPVCCGKLVEFDKGGAGCFAACFKHGVVDGIAFVPNAKFGAHAVVLFG